MYNINKIYKINVTMEDGFKTVLTGIIKDEDEHSIRIITVKNEDMIVKKSRIDKAKMMGDNDENAY